MNENRVYTLITGGSRGIGYALARECAGRGMNLLLVAKQGDGLDNAREKLRAEFPAVDIQARIIDLRETEGPRKVLDWCQEEGYRVNMLVNNAGTAGTAVFEESDPYYTDERILLNVRALALLTRLFIPELKSHPEAYLLNIGSMSAYYSIAYKSVYAGTKAFVHRFTRGLRQELQGTNIKITVVNPNGVRTNPGTHERINSHRGITQRLFIHEASEIARISIEAVLKGRLVLVPGFFNRALLFITKLLPAGYRERRTAKMFRKEILNG